ncbi:protein odr-4 homolog isoform X2 [Lingula anatina]|uniref:Protein odr-4 homolog isoform X2 n=1 Tax=Lingula anatina TaxID=7574 RepID=A0A1S3KCX6_LINAN|nr:protein odr-4 homolog isoform X2 [Lingula anatina]|eukprot:XP_013420299.1 protein odr-4 homolog isoform X2 [Lingula anatina]
MGRTVLAEERLENYIQQLYGEKQECLVGLIIGQLTSQRDYVIHMARTPPPEEEEDKDETGKTKSSMPPLDKTSEHWVVTHAKQVVRMLPGSMDVIGIFAMAPPDMMQKAQAKLRQLIFAIHKALSKAQNLYNRDPPTTDRVLLQICNTTRKLTCRTFDVADHKCTTKPAEWKFSSFLDGWSRVETSLSVNTSIPVPIEKMSSDLEKQIHMGLAPFCDRIWNSLGTIDGQFCDVKRLLDTSSETQKKGKRDKTSANISMKKFNVDLLMQMSSGSTTEPTVTSCGATMLIRGRIVGRAFLPHKATVEDALKAIKTDLIRSLISRCDLLCEDLLQSEEEQDPKILYETPVRIFTKLGSTPLTMCDYIFQDEKLQDVIDRNSELMELHLTDEQVELDFERIPEENELVKPEKRRRTVSGSFTEHKASSQNSVIGCVIL